MVVLLLEELVLPQQSVIAESQLKNLFVFVANFPLLLSNPTGGKTTFPRSFYVQMGTPVTALIVANNTQFQQTFGKVQQAT